MQNHAVGVGRRHRQVADQPEVRVPHRHRHSARYRANRHRLRQPALVGVKAGQHQVMPPGEGFAPIADVQDPFLHVRHGRGPGNDGSVTITGSTTVQYDSGGWRVGSVQRWNGSRP
jgi:hypothetical protein